MSAPETPPLAGGSDRSAGFHAGSARAEMHVASPDVHVRHLRRERWLGRLAFAAFWAAGVVPYVAEAHPGLLICGMPVVLLAGTAFFIAGLRVAASACVDERLRVALEKAADGELEEDDLALADEPPAAVEHR